MNFDVLDEDETLALVLLMYKRQRDKKKKAKPRRFWIRPWVTRRLEFGCYENLLKELELESPEDFHAFLRMEPEMFHEIVMRIGERITKQDTNWRKAHVPGLKIAITLRFMATGNKYRDLEFYFRVPHNTISKFVPVVCEAIIEEFSYLISLPEEEEGWKEKGQSFYTKWNLPHAVGAIDGKHIAIKKPRKSTSLYHNYKGFFSMILLGVVDANYRFIWVNIGANGSTSDCAVFNISDLKEGFDEQTNNLPEPDFLPRTDMPFPYFLIGDDGFPLKEWLLKPFAARNLTEAERIYNYRISRARRIVENGFGILANRYRCLLTTLEIKPENVVSVVLACICLHNVMRTRYPLLQNRVMDREQDDHTFTPGEWRSETLMHDLDKVKAPNAMSRLAKATRVKMMHYVNNIGSVPWQWDMV